MLKGNIIAVLLTVLILQTFALVTYKGADTILECHSQTPFDALYWFGPTFPVPNATTLYYSGSYLNQALGNKTSRLSIDGINFNMVITDTQLADKGVYRCIKRLNSSSYVLRTTLQVRIRSNVPTMTTSVSIDDKGLRAIEDSAFNVVCLSSGGYPVPTVALYKGGISGQELASTSNGTQVGNTFTVTLTHAFIPTRQDDGQVLMCRSYYPTPVDAQDSQNITEQLYLYLKPLQPTVTHTGSVIKGNDVKVKCNTTGSRPAATISWIYNDENVTTGVSTTTNTTNKDTETVVSVFRKLVAAADNGQTVQCRVTHAATDTFVTKSTTLNVLFPVDKFTTTLTGNKNMIANGVNLLLVNCTTGSSNPVSNITWINGSTVISNVNEYTTMPGVNNGYVRSQVLNLQPTRYAHGNRIACSVSNGVLQETDTVSVVLDLRFSPVITISTPSTQIIPEEPEVPLTSLPCSVDSNPLSRITWFHNDQVVTQATMGSSLSYSITNANRTSYGIYTCSADNGIPPDDSKSYTVDILFRPLDITIQKHPLSVIADGSNPMTIVCTSDTSNPVSSITWATGIIQTGTPTSTATAGGYGGIIRTSTISFIPTRDHDGLVVSCEARNNMTGNQRVSRSSVIDNIKYSPIISHLFDKNVTEGISATLKCSAHSKPLASFIWRTDSKTLQTGIGTDNYNGLDYIISNVNRSQTGTYTCIADNNIQPSDVKQMKLTVQYSPIISDLFDKNVTEGISATLKCSAHSKPLASFIWRKDSKTLQTGIGTDNYNGLDYIISNVNRSQTGTYTCIADNNIQPSDVKQMKLTVQYPPDVVVTATNTSVKGSSATITCEASGVPDRYTYEIWHHAWWNGQMVLGPNPLPAARVLTLTDLTYAHSGVYTCRASNGINGASTGSGHLLVQSFPVLIGVVATSKEIKISGKLYHRVQATFQYYSNVDVGTVKVYKDRDFRKEVGEVQLREVDIKLPVFLSEITTTGTEATITLALSSESQFGTYDIVVTNKIGDVELSLVIQPTGPPNPPYNLNVTVLDDQTVVIIWKSGFANGLNQTFVIQLSTDRRTWLNITQFGGKSFQQSHIKIISQLTSSKLYYVRMVSVNDKGESKPTNEIRFTTEEQAQADSTFPTDVFAGGTGVGVLVSLVVVAVIVLIIWRRKYSLFLGIRCIKDKSDDRISSSQFHGTNGNGKNGNTDAAGTDTEEPSQDGQQYEELKSTQHKRVYDQWDPTIENPHTYENSGLSPYQSLQRREENDKNTYDQVQHQERRSEIYENLKVTSAV